MRNLIPSVLLCLALICGAAVAAVEVEPPRTCHQCRMDRTTFAHSRMLVEYRDATVVGVCSIHCAAAELLQHREKPVKSLRVADYNSKLLIEAKDAYWVVGGDRRGVMTFVPKWAFTRAAEAEAFVREHGGAPTPFAAVMEAANVEAAEAAAP